MVAYQYALVEAGVGAHVVAHFVGAARQRELRIVDGGILKCFVLPVGFVNALHPVIVIPGIAAEAVFYKGCPGV